MRNIRPILFQINGHFACALTIFVNHETARISNILKGKFKYWLFNLFTAGLKFEIFGLAVFRFLLRVAGAAILFSSRSRYTNCVHGN